MRSLKLPLPALKRLPQFDRLLLGTVALLALLIALVLWRGDRSVLRVTQFSWEGQKVGAADQEFILSFNRPVDRPSVEQNLTIEPPLPGKMSWSGRNLFYTPEERPIYGINYQIQLQGAKTSDSDRFGEPFASLFTTRDRAFAYIGIAPEERGRLVLFNITQQQKTILTPSDLAITDYAIYPQGDKIVFSAYELADGSEGANRQQLYTVTTGLDFQESATSRRAGKLKVLLDAKDYTNQQFELSDNGNTLIVQRKNRRNPADAGLWAIFGEQPPRPLGVPGGEFALAPDGKSVAVSQQGGVAVIPLVPEAGGQKFFAGYEKSLGFSPEGSKQLAVRNNPDYTRSLVLLERDGEARDLFKSINPIVSCQFEPREKKLLYCLKTDLVVSESGQYQEELYLSAIDLTTGKDFPLLALPNYRDVQLSMSPDGVALLFDQLVATLPNDPKALMAGKGKAISDGRLWLFTLPELVAGKEKSEVIPEELNPGFKPQWLP
jgi:dipeptidyl aminopeptidase/acylaminoacyl peptidase